MLGVLVCTDENGKSTALAALSGTTKTLRITKNVLCIHEHSEAKTESVRSETMSITVVPPIVSAEKIADALRENDELIHKLTEKIVCVKSSDSEKTAPILDKLRAERKKLCATSLKNVFALYTFFCIDGKKRNLSEICAEYNKSNLPPTGTGECCAPKLLDYAFRRHMHPISLAETIFPAKKDANEQKNAVRLVPPCDERCGILLPALLGLRILYRDDDIIVVNKQPGLLSVPGRGEDKQDCIESRVKRLFPHCIAQPAVHRLDMETSGILILAFTKEAHRTLSKQFEQKEVEKKYIALLDGIPAKKGIANHGHMELFFRLDIENRPRQIWDRENGKRAVTEWHILNIERYTDPDGKTRNAARILFMPHTGRTHQLRLAAADSHGFGIPIIGDSLYGTRADGERLMLHARNITFTHPTSGKRITIECAEDF